MYDYYNDVKVTISDDCPKEPTARSPYYQLRGKPVTSQQAFDILKKTDFFYTSFFYKKKIELQRINQNAIWLGGDYFCNSWFIPHFLDGSGQGWVNSEGYVGLNYWAYKLPEIKEFAEEWAMHLHYFPYLDLFIGITEWNEGSPERWKVIFHENFDPYAEYDNEEFIDAIEMGIWVHEGRVDFVGKERAQQLYEEYERLYYTFNGHKRVPGHYDGFVGKKEKWDYFTKCIQYHFDMTADEYVRIILSEDEYQKLLKYYEKR